MSEEEIIKFLSCDNCKFATCEQCEINYTTKKAIKDLIEKQDKMIDLMAQELIDMPIKIMLGHASFEYRNKEDTIEHFRNERLKDE